MRNTESAYIIFAYRSPIGRIYGSLSHIRPDDLIAGLLKASLEKENIQSEDLEAIWLGCSNQAGEDNRNIARMAVLLAGLPSHVFASTVNSLCASGMDAIQNAARTVMLGEAELVLAGGVESMSRSPWIESRTDGERVDSTVGWRFVNPKLIEQGQLPLSMPETAELLAKRWNISRKEQDLYAFNSRQRYKLALEQGHFDAEIIPVDWPEQKRSLAIDEQHRLFSLKALQKLPCLVPGGDSVSLGNSARIGDGAAILAIASESYIKKHGIQPLARIKAMSIAAEQPEYMGISPVLAIRKALRQSNLSLEEIGLIEIGEAFSVQMLACMQALRLSEEQVNPYGGSISMGNPLGMSAARIVVSLCHALNRQPQYRYALGASCAGLGIGTALILERC